MIISCQLKRGIQTRVKRSQVFVLSALLAVASTAPALSIAQSITYSFDDGTMQGWRNTMVSTAAAGYYDLSFGAVTQTGHDNWGAGPNPTWSVTGGGQVPPTGPYFLGEIPFANQIGTTVWSNWPAGSSGAQQTIMAQSPAFTLAGGPLTFLGCGNSKGVPLTTMGAIPAIGGTWGAESGNLESTKGSCAVGLLRDDGSFVIYKNFQGSDAWITYTFTAAELLPFVNDGHSYTLAVVDFWSGQNSWCAIDDVTIPGNLYTPNLPLQMSLNTNKTKLQLTWNPGVEGQCSVLSSDDLTRPLGNWIEVTNIATQNGAVSTEIPLPATKMFFRTKLNPPAPAAPSSVIASTLNFNSILLTWSNVPSATGYKIEQKTGAAGSFVQIATADANATAYTVSGLAGNTLYYFRVRATNVSGDSVYSTTVSATTSSTAVGLYAEYFNNQNLTGSPTLTRIDATVDFNWAQAAPDAALPADNFSVRWTGKVQPQYSQNYTFYTLSDDGVRLWVNNTKVVDNWTGHSATENSGAISLTAGQQYDIRMEFFDSGSDAVARLSWASASTPKAVIPTARLYLPPPPPAPAAPSGLIASAISGSKINLTWTDNATNETGFKIERRPGSGGAYAEIATVGANVTTYASTGLTPSTEYSYRVRANNGISDSDYCAEAKATTGDASQFENPGVYSKIVNNLRYEWIASREVNFEITADGKVKIIAPLTKQSFNGANTCKRFIYDHTHTRLSTADSTALFGSGLMLPTGNYGFAIQWLNASTYDEIPNRGWDLTANPATYQGNSAKVDYIYLSIVPVTPSAPPAPGPIAEIAIPDGLQRVSWLPHYQLLPYTLNLPADRGFGVTRLLMDVPLEQVLQRVTQLAYMYGFLDNVPHSKEWFVLRAYPNDTVESVIRNAIVDTKFGYMSQMDEDFGSREIYDPEHTKHAQQVLEGIYHRLENEKGVTSPNQTRLYDDYFSDMAGFSNSETFRWNFNASKLVSYLASQETARQNNGGTQLCAYFSQGAYAYRNWFQGAYLDSFERTPEGIRLYNEIYNFEKKFMAAPDRKVAKFSWIYAEGVNSEMYRMGSETRLHFPNGDIIRNDFVAWPFHMMLNESFWALLLGHDFYLWNSSVTMNSSINTFGDSWYGGSQVTKWQPTGGSIVDYNQNNPAHPQRIPSPAGGQFPEAPQLGESGSFAGAWLVSQLTTVSDRISITIEYCPFTYKTNNGPSKLGYYNSSTPSNGSLGNAKLSRFGVANYGQANIVKSYEARKPICVYTQGANGAAVIYHNPYCGLTDVNEVTITPASGTRTFQVIGNSLHIFYLN